jgi:hypothetical protein
MHNPLHMPRNRNEAVTCKRDGAIATSLVILIGFGNDFWLVFTGSGKQILNGLSVSDSSAEGITVTVMVYLLLLLTICVIFGFVKNKGIFILLYINFSIFLVLINSMYSGFYIFSIVEIILIFTIYRGYRGVRFLQSDPS